MRRTSVFALVVVVCVGAAWTAAQAPVPSSDTFSGAIRSNDLPQLRTLVRSTAAANATGTFGYTPLMDAAVAGSLETVQYLIDQGADVNAHSDTGLTPLMLAVGDTAKERVLLDHGARINASSKAGRTAVFLAAMHDQSADEVRYLVARGADVTMKDAFGNTVLAAATVGTDIETIRLAVNAGIDVNAAAITGFVPLLQAAGSQNVEAVKLLISKGANVNAVAADPSLAPGPNPKTGPVQLHSYTPLLAAAAFGPPDLVKALLDAGADVNASESRKLTPLMLAVANDHQDPDVIRLLLAHGADPARRGTQLGTAADWATRAGRPDGIALLHAPKPQIAAAAVTSAPLDPKTAVQRSIGLLETTSQAFFEKSGCVGCHAQPITSMAAAEARLKGVRVDQTLTAERTGQLETGGPPPFALAEQLDIQVSEIVAWPLAGLAAAGEPSSRTTDAMAINVSRYQNRDGAWHHLYGKQSRPGAEDGDIFRTALAVRGLAVYGPRGRAKDMDDRIARAREWLLHATTLTQDDRNMQLLGLVWAGAPASALKPFTDGVLARQQPDGGWRQHDALGTDALATGQALYALAKSGIPTSDPRYQKGVHYLLTTQRTSDGSWRVESRAPKFQTFFQSGFPYAGDQWISAWATGWSAMALAQVIR